MDVESKIKKESEEKIKNRTDEVWIKHRDFIGDILYYAVLDNTEELSKTYLWLLTLYFLEYYSEREEDEEYLIDAVEHMLDCIENNCKFKADSEIIKQFYKYLYIIRQSVFWSLGQSYIEGISYTELIEGVLKKAGIENISDESMKKIYNSFIVYLKKCNDRKGSFEMNALSTWSSYVGLKEKNKGQSSIAPVLYRDKAAYEFEFYIKPKNKSSDEELQNITEKLEEETKKRLITIFEELELKEIIQDWNRYRKKYSRLAQTPLRDMSEEELRLYLKFMDCKRIYVRRNSDGNPDHGVLAERWLGHILAYSLLEQHYSTCLVEQDFSIAGGILSKIIRRLSLSSPQELETQFISFSPDISLKDFLPDNSLPETVFWNGMLHLLNIMDNCIMKLNEQGLGLPRSYCQVFEDKKKFDQFKCICENETVIQSSLSKEIIRNQFINKLQKDNAGWQDLIEICCLTTYCILWAEEWNEKAYSQKMLDRRELDLFGMAFTYIIEFLKCCARKSEDKNRLGEEKVNISSEIAELKNKLASLKIVLNTEDFIPAYYGGSIQKDGKKKKVSYKDYFQKCLETAPVRLYILLENRIESGNPINIEMFIQKYMETILERRKGEEVLVPPQYDKLLEKILYVRLTSSVRYRHRVQFNIQDFYDKQQDLLSLCDKYDIKRTFWYSGNTSCEADEYF